MKPATVMVVDDDDRFVRSLSRLIAHDHQFELVGVALDVDTAIELADASRPDLAIVDVDMPGGGGSVVAESVRARSPHTKIIALSGRKDRDSVFDMVSSGASSYLLKGSSWNQVATTMRQALFGQSTIAAEVAGDVVNGLAEELRRRRAAESALVAKRDPVLRIIREKRLRIEWQPIVDLDTGVIVGVEALSRFDDDHKGGPGGWYEQATVVGLRQDLELLAIELAMHDAERIPDGVGLAVNLLPETLFAERLETIVGDEAHRLTLEVTEQAPIADYSATADVLGAWRGRGAQLAVDDAGAGFASLRHILELAPDTIKLDRSITSHVDHDNKRRALTKALVTFADELGARVVAEGIETAEELRALRDLGVALGQGWLLARPHPAAAGSFREPISFPRALGEGDAPAIRPPLVSDAASELSDQSMLLPEAARHVVEVCGRHLRTSIVYLAYVDQAADEWIVVRSSVPDGLPPGHREALSETPCLGVLRETTPDQCARVSEMPALAELGLMRRVSTESYAMAMVRLPDRQAVLCLAALSPRPDQHGGAEHDLLAAGARVLDAALHRELDGHSPEEVRTRVRAIARTDAVTGVLNAESWEIALREHLADVEQGGGPSAAVLVRLSALDTIRNSYGQAKADLLVRRFAHRIVEGVRENDAVGRLEPDLFGVVLKGHAHAGQADAIARIIADASRRVAVQDGLPGDAVTAVASLTDAGGLQAVETARRQLA